MTIRTAELLSVGTELTVGTTRDTNAGDLARDLTERGVVVNRITAVPDDLGVVADAFAAATARSDLVVSTGGLGPTPDDLTREAIAATLGESPAVDPELERWLRGLFERRRIPFPEANRKQAWLIPSAEAIPNANGTAPGWLVRIRDSILVALPGPPREMAPMWREWVLPRLEALGLGRPSAAVTLRLTGIGESAVADRLGSLLDPGARPSVATYARADAVDVRISAVDDGLESHGSAAALVRDAERRIVELVGEHVWARGRTSWPEAVAEALDVRGWRVAIAEVGLRGALVALLGEGLGERLAHAEVHGSGPTARARSGAAKLASAVRRAAAADVGLAAEVHSRGADTAVSVALDGPAGTRRETRVVFLGGSLGRGRAALAAAAVLLAYLEGRPAASGPGHRSGAAVTSRGPAGPATVSRT